MCVRESARARVYIYMYVCMYVCVYNIYMYYV